MEASKAMRAGIQHAARLECVRELCQVLVIAKRTELRGAPISVVVLRYALHSAAFTTGKFVMIDFGKMLIVLGGILLVAGVVLVLLGRTNLPIDRLPGDILYRGKNTTFYFPLATSIVLSVLLSLILYVIGRWRR
jgi:hypothetical protein